MKKAFFLSLIFFFALALAGFTPVKADSVVVNGSYTDTDTLSQADYDELQNTALLLKYLQNGGVVDVSNVSDGYSVSDLVSDFGNFVKEVVPDLVDVINPFQSKFEYTPLGNAMLNNNMYKFLGMLPFYALSEPENPTPTPTPNENYSSYINIINGDIGTGYDFFWKDYPQFTTINNYPFELIMFPWSNYTYFTPSSNVIISAFNTNRIYACDIVDINIISNNDTYSFNLSLTPDVVGYVTDTNPYTNCVGIKFTTSNNQPVLRLDLVNQYPVQTYTYSGTLDAVFGYIQSHFRNVNIYVDDVLWAYVGNTTNYSLQIYNDTVSPVATNDYGYVHWVYDYEIFFRIDRIWDILQDILDNMDNNNPSTQIIRWDNLDDVIVDVDGQPAVAVKIYTPDNNIDEEYWSKYGPLVPVFIPLATPVINDSDILLIAETPMSALPDDLLDVFGYIFIGMLFVCFIHRLLE